MCRQPGRLARVVTTLGLIGSGHIGSQLARLAVRNGYDVVLSNSRGPASLAGLVQELGPQARAATPDEAATAGDLVVVTIPLHALDTVPVEPLAGKVVIDTNNYYPQRDGQIPELDDESTTVSELLCSASTARISAATAPAPGRWVGSVCSMRTTSGVRGPARRGGGASSWMRRGLTSRLRMTASIRSF